MMELPIHMYIYIAFTLIAFFYYGFEKVNSRGGSDFHGDGTINILIIWFAISIIWGGIFWW
jgi:hypothetical protein